MIIARVQRIKFHLNGNKHCVTYANRGNALTRDVHYSDIKAVIVNDLKEAENKLRKLVQNYLSKCFMHDKQFNFEDFTFTIYYEEIENGEFWLIPSSIDLHEHKVSD